MTKRMTARICTFIVSMLVASLFIFTLLNLLPGNIAQVILGANATDQAVAELEQKLGLNDPFWLRYFNWITHMLVGDFGQSALNNRQVISIITEKMSVTCWLVGISTVLTILVSFPLGMYAAIHRRKWRGFFASTFSQIGMAIPAFLMVLILVIIFAIKLGWLPSGGYVPLLDDPLEWARHLILPVAAIVIVQSSMMVRFVRSAFIEVLSEDYYRVARAAGWSKWAALWRHGLRNASLSVVTVIGLQMATLFVGTIVVEYVLVIPGLGSQLLSSVSNRDLPVVQAIVLILVFIVLLINLIVDLSYLLLDPRVRAKSAGDSQ